MSHKIQNADAELIAKRTAAWNKRPIISTEMFGKTSWEHKACKKAKGSYEHSMKTYHGKKLQKNLQETILSKDFTKSPLMKSATINLQKIKF